MDLKLKKNIALMIRTLYFCMEEQWAQLEKEHNISPAQQHILFLLATNEKVLTPTQISKLGCWHISTVTRLLKPMQNRGFIIVTTDKKQPRYKNVTLTDEGKRLLNHLISSVQNMERFPLDMNHLSEQEIIDFLRYGQLIIDAHKGVDFKNKVINAQVTGYNY